MNKQTMIWITFQKEGIHCYPAAATIPELSEQRYLASPHRHIFHFKVAIEVFTDDRDIEFIQFKRWVENQYRGDILTLDYKSCEMISDDLYEVITAKYPNRDIRIEVSEDGENGSETYYKKAEASKPSVTVTVKNPTTDTKIEAKIDPTLNSIENLSLKPDTIDVQKSLDDVEKKDEVKNESSPLLNIASLEDLVKIVLGGGKK